MSHITHISPSHHSTPYELPTHSKALMSHTLHTMRPLHTQVMCMPDSFHRPPPAAPRHCQRTKLELFGLSVLHPSLSSTSAGGLPRNEGSVLHGCSPALMTEHRWGQHLFPCSVSRGVLLTPSAHPEFNMPISFMPCCVVLCRAAPCRAVPMLCCVVLCRAAPRRRCCPVCRSQPLWPCVCHARLQRHAVC